MFPPTQNRVDVANVGRWERWLPQFDHRKVKSRGRE